MTGICELPVGFTCCNNNMLASRVHCCMVVCSFLPIANVTLAEQKLKYTATISFHVFVDVCVVVCNLHGGKNVQICQLTCMCKSRKLGLHMFVLACLCLSCISGVCSVGRVVEPAPHGAFPMSSPHFWAYFLPEHTREHPQFLFTEIFLPAAFWDP